MERFLGRTAELEPLQRLFNKKSASLIVVRGRRRIGKSRLIEEFAKGQHFLSFAGQPPHDKVTAQEQRDEFVRQLAEQTGFPEIQADDWSKLFKILADQVKEGRWVVLLDEISWMGSEDPAFLSKIKTAWDQHLKKNPQLILVLCGSASAWIEANVLSHTGFVGRISYTLTLEELPLTECSHFWNDTNVAAYEKLKLLAVLGGIPKYLEEINPKLTAETNIKHLCFTRGGFLVNEFDRIFSDLFFRRDTIMYKRIVSALADGPKEYKTLSSHIGLDRSGRLTEYLQELELGGFIQRHPTWNLKTTQQGRLSLYRLSDNYLRFYLKYIEPNKAKIDRQLYEFKSLYSMPGWETVMGLQFENLVLNNRSLIHQALQLTPDDILTANPYFQHQTKRHSSCQIDYLIQARGDALYVCEIKFSKNRLGHSLIQEVQAKIDKLAKPKHVSCRPVLIHVNGVTEKLQQSDYFYAIIDLTQFL